MYLRCGRRQSPLMQRVQGKQRGVTNFFLVPWRADTNANGSRGYCHQEYGHPRLLSSSIALIFACIKALQPEINAPSRTAHAEQDLLTTWSARVIAHPPSAIMGTRTCIFVDHFPS
jgi:hypothetical protein